MIETFALIVFYALMALFAFYSFLLIYVLARFAQSKLLALLLSALYISAQLVFYSNALYYFEKIQFIII